jgi:REP element-mobilizing transposase RayT
VARQLRIQYQGAVYHTTSRGNARNYIFQHEKDRNDLLTILEKTVKRHNWLCHAYCIMGNHYHLLVETPDANLAKGMQLLNQMYTQRYNRRHKRVGHVFQGRYKSFLVEKEAHLLELSRYIVLNPVRANLVDCPSKWRWSSYNATAGHGWPRSFLTTEWILSQFSFRKGEARRLYKEFVHDGIGMGSPMDKVRHHVFLGGDTFIELSLNGQSSNELIYDVPRDQRLAARPSLKELFSNEEIASLALRNEKIGEAFELHGYTLRQIGKFLGLHPDYLSRINKRLRKRSGGRA